MIETVLVEYEIKITRASERLAKIEALEEAAKRFLKVEYRVECFYGVLNSMIAELKEEI